MSAAASEWDVIVLGAGPAGVTAAIAASRHGLRVVLLDEQHHAGGQVYRAVPPEFALAETSRSPDHRLGDALRAELAGSAVERRLGRRVWLAEAGFTVKAVGPEGLETYCAPRFIVATGTTERVAPIPGWTLPGVIGLAAATVALKAQKLLPGRRTVVAGVGPLVPAVAAAIVEGGGTVAMALDLAGPADWLKALPRLASRPDLLRRGLGWLAQLRRAGVPVRHRHGVVAIDGGEGVASVRVAAVDGAWRPTGASETVTCDSVTIGHGLVPATEVDAPARRAPCLSRRGRRLDRRGRCRSAHQRRRALCRGRCRRHRRRRGGGRARAAGRPRCRRRCRRRWTRRARGGALGSRRARSASARRWRG